MATRGDQTCQRFEATAVGFETGFSRLRVRPSNRYAIAPHKWSYLIIRKLQFDQLVWLSVHSSNVFNMYGFIDAVLKWSYLIIRKLQSRLNHRTELRGALKRKFWAILKSQYNVKVANIWMNTLDS